jgi:diacylglycerol kinase family enzyme
MDRSPETLLHALRAARTLRVDAMTIEDQGAPPEPEVSPPGVLSLLMCSIGPDAGVIRRLTQLRTRAIGHLAYCEPIVREWLAPSFVPITAELDGRILCDRRVGTLIVANSRQYAFRIDPARRADMTDGLLDVVFLPGGTRRAVLAWALRCRLRRPIEAAGAICATGREVRVTTGAPAPYQIDGDSPGWRGAGQRNCPPECSPLSLRVAVWPGALLVLLPR